MSYQTTILLKSGTSLNPHLHENPSDFLRPIVHGEEPRVWVIDDAGTHFVFNRSDIDMILVVPDDDDEDDEDDEAQPVAGIR